MKVLMVHNFYGSSAPSGENQVFVAEQALLRARGHEVIELTRHSDEIRARGMLGAVQGALATPWNPWMVRALRQEMQRSRPDVMHVHNTFPLVSPAIFHTAGPVARVITLHNYRLFCAAGTPLRGCQVCTECLDRRSAWSALKYGCYRESRLATAPVALSVALHRKLGTWTQHVDAFIALTAFQRERMVGAGLPADRVHVKPNLYARNVCPIAYERRGEYVVFAGRLSVEKGVDTLIRAWILWGSTAPELRIVGDGPLRQSLQQLAASALGTRIRFLGQVSAAESEQQIATGRLLVLPSISFEGFPMVICEALARGTPVAASDIGPFPCIVEERVNGILFRPRDAQSLVQEVRKAWETPGLLERLSEGARRSFEGSYTEGANYQTVMSIYEQAKVVRRARISDQ